MGNRGDSVRYSGVMVRCSSAFIGYHYNITSLSGLQTYALDRLKPCLRNAILDGQNI